MFPTTVVDKVASFAPVPRLASTQLAGPSLLVVVVVRARLVVMATPAGTVRECLATAVLFVMAPVFALMLHAAVADKQAPAALPRGRISTPIAHFFQAVHVHV
jgi:hypothetical protein